MEAERLVAGDNDAEVTSFLVARYGEFVLYRPRMEATTWLLWLGPAVLLLAGGYVISRIVRKRAPTAPAADDTEQEW